MSGERRRTGFVVKVLVSLGLLAALLSRQPLEEIRAALAHPQWSWLLVSFAVYAVSAVVGVVPWAWLLRGAGSAAGVGLLTRLYLIGLFFNNFLPANVGGDIYKVIDLGRCEHNPQRAFAATVLDRLLGLAALTLVAVVAAGLALGKGIAVPPVAWVLALVLVGLAAAGALLLSRRGATGVRRVLAGLHLPSLARRVDPLAAAFRVYRRQPGVLGRALILGLGIQALRVGVHVLVARGLGLSLTGAQVLQFFVLVPLLAVSLTLPISINGIGLREALAAILLPWTGLPAQSMVAVEVTTFLVQVAFSLVGGVVFWAGRARSEVAVAGQLEG
jgi:glycosyltransferase 2 family protein